MVDEVDHGGAFALVDQGEVVEVQSMHPFVLFARQAADEIREGEDFQAQTGSGGVAVAPFDHRSLSHFDHSHA